MHTSWLFIAVMLCRRETLMMAAQLRLPEAMTDEAKEAYVDGIIQRLGMTKSADTIVGDAKVRSLSVQHGPHTEWC